jgi:hypothetical protein
MYYIYIRGIYIYISGVYIYVYIYIYPENLFSLGNYGGWNPDFYSTIGGKACHFPFKKSLETHNQHTFDGTIFTF